ncbi:hypothetical protein [Capnocytophaga catalasegens]|uniref:hypothetical protein n=1 Tax=Capnocytophaga catalasegens TaxID=1004260 RepID=UPI00222E8F5E|nr:hypothetical protein [Capnocytophaga catalasegens]
MLFSAFKQKYGLPKTKTFYSYFSGFARSVNPNVFNLSVFARSVNPSVSTFRDLPEASIQVFLLFGICPKRQSECFHLSGFPRNVNPSVFIFQNFPETSIRVFSTFN